MRKFGTHGLGIDIPVAGHAARGRHQAPCRSGAGLCRAALAALLVAVLAACGGGASDGVGSESSAPTAPTSPTSPTAPPVGAASTGYDLNVDPNPLAATITLDNARTASADMSIDGGTLTATDANGVSYTLNVPANALSLPVTITMTPLASVSGVPLGEQAYGVQLGPDGLQFLNFATLTVTPAAGMSWPVNQQIPIALNGSANLVSLAAVDTNSAVPIFKLLHFSSYVVLLSEKGFDASLSDVRKRIGGSEEQRLQSAAAEVLSRERQRQLLGQAPGELAAQLDALRKEFEEKVVKPRIAAAGTSCAAAQLAIQTLLGNERQRQLLGMPESSLDPMGLLAGSLGDTATEVCMREEYEICRDEHIVTRIAPRLFAVMRGDALLGIMNPKRQQVAEEYTRKCLQFEVQFDSDVNIAVGFPAHTVTETVSARLKLGFALNGVDLPPDAPAAIRNSFALIGNSGSLPLVSQSYTASYSKSCYTVAATERLGGQLVGAFLGIVPDANSPSNPGGANRVKDFALSLALSPSALGISNHTVIDTDNGDKCDKSPTTEKVLEGWFVDLWSPWAASIVTPDSGALASNWSMLGNQDIMATRDQSVDFVDGDKRSRGTVRMVLFHKPIR